MVHHHQTIHSSGVFAFAACGLIALSAACSDGQVDLGDGVVTQDLSQASRCAESTRISGNVFIANQSELEELAGCEEVTGELRIQLFEGADLAPLSSLRVVGEVLRLGTDPEVFPEDPEEQAAHYALQEAGYLASLHGLEALESVNVLAMDHVLVGDLSELESLRSARLLLAYHMQNLRSLAGLEQVTLSDIWLTDCQAIESLNGLQMGGSSGGIILDSVHALTNIDAIAGVNTVNGVFMLSGTALESLPELSLFANQISIDNNAELVDASGLSGLQGVIELYVAANPKLREFPALPLLGGFNFLTVVGNDALETLALDFPGLQPQPRLLQDREVDLGISLIEIGWNSSLKQITSPASPHFVRFFSIYENASLSDVDLGPLERSDLILIDKNAVLESVTAPNLATVDELEVTDNPQLYPVAFDAVQTFSRVVSGNASTP